MPQTRKNIDTVADTPYYHCIGGCVRRAFPCGKDAFSGKDIKHRRQWLVDRLNLLSSAFAIDVCAYAVMSNHYHLVFRLAPESSNHWSQSEVIERWQKLTISCSELIFSKKNHQNHFYFHPSDNRCECCLNLMD